MANVELIKTDRCMARKITDTVPITVTKFLELQLSTGEAIELRSHKYIDWIASEEERINFLKQYNNGHYMYAYFLEVNQMATMQFEGKEQSFKLNDPKSDEVKYLFSDFNSIFGDKPVLVTFEEFEKLVDNVKNWVGDVKEMFAKNEEKKALLYKNNRSLIAAKKFVLVK